MSIAVFVPCPFHDPAPGEYAKSLEINQLSQSFHCYGCKAGGRAQYVGDLGPVPLGAVEAEPGVWYELENDTGGHHADTQGPR